MVNKQEIADSLQISINSLLDAIRYDRLTGTVDDAAVAVVGGSATVVVFLAPYACKVKAVTIRAETNDTAGGIDVVKAASAIALTSGTPLITQVLTSELTDATNHTCEVLTASNVNQLVVGDSLAIIISGTTTLTGLQYTVVIERLN